ncbi:hypothetical protein GE061_011341 [Apolygus lucorum]|uniref:Biogenesis of lysosome-related organelles complex 1 subunit 5 n=1 Tax=Apolygus lucorum TaxID=248454 RepID=A0A6A4JQA4_APOLU|nr:hypothetical protein GE061_011341 [Apolygus lucorum]
MSLSLIKDCSDIWFRLFDHRPFLNGEIKQFTKDYEESRGDREVVKLFEILEWTTDVRDEQIDKIVTNSNKLDKINTLLEIALQNSNTVLENESSYSVDRALSSKRAMRKLEWEKFMCDVDSKYTKIEETFRGKERELSQFYKDLEQKLHVE